MELYEKNGNPIYILNVLKKYSDEDHKLSAVKIGDKVKEIYDVDIDSRTVRRNINLLKEKLGYDISTREENKEGYYITQNPDTDFEPGEVRAIMDTFSYASYIIPSVANNIIEKCKNLQNIYENEKLKDYRIYSIDNKTDNMEVIKNMEDLTEAIYESKKVKLEYWKYEITDKLEKIVVSTPKISPYALVYNKQQFYVIAIKEGQDKFYYYRLDRIKNLKILDEKITIKKTNKEIKDFAESTVEMFGGKKEQIEAICNRVLLNAVLDEFGKSITIEKISGDDENFKLKLDTSEIGFKMWAMRNIDLVEVIKPTSLREEIKGIIEEAKTRYKK